MKQAIFQTILGEFTRWAEDKTFVCAKGCAKCCTTNVTLTHLEATRILDHILKNNLCDWFERNILSVEHCVTKPDKTTNEYIASCLTRNASAQSVPANSAPCPFLQNDICSIYPVRPFVCLFFASEESCQKKGSALVPDHYLTGATVVMQLIEHLNQFKPWGNMLDMLTALSQLPPYAERFHPQDHAESCHKRLLSAQPIPGFLIPEEDQSEVSPLLESILHQKIGVKTIEQIFNGG